MTAGLRGALQRLVDFHTHGAGLALLFDYDGTLVPLAPHPDLAVLDPGTRERLVRLAGTPAVSVGVISGRGIDDVRAAVGVRSLYYAGSNGLELDLGGELIIHPESDGAARLVVMVAARVQRAIAGYPGAWLEQKPLALTVHYRGVDSDRSDALRTWITNAIRPFVGRLHVIEGQKAVEVVPNLGWTKGSALMRIVAHAGRGVVVPLYAGDDANDADAMTAAVVLGGVALGVGANAPQAAQYRLPDHPSLCQCMDTLLELFAASRRQPAT